MRWFLLAVLLSSAVGCQITAGITTGSKTIQEPTPVVKTVSAT